MTAAMLRGIAGIEQKTLENSAAYLKTWIARLKPDSRLLVSAASQSQKAADFIQRKLVHQEDEGQPVGVDAFAAFTKGSEIQKPVRRMPQLCKPRLFHSALRLCR